METRNFGTRSGLDVPRVSIGAMRLPQDVCDAVNLLRHAIDSGMRYIDTCRGYGESEFILSRALQDGYREKVILSTKCSPWIRKIRDDDDGSADSVRRRIDESMTRLGVDYLDFYQVWNIHNQEGWDLALKKGGMVEGILKARDEKLVRHLGFTTHEKPEELLRRLDDLDWCEITLLTYNLINRDYGPVLKAFHEKGIGTIVMNPVGGGKLAEKSPVVMKLVDELELESDAELAVRHVLSNPHVDTILCGLSKKSDVDSTIDYAARGPLSDEQQRRCERYMGQFSRENVHFCTNCQYCMPCPAGIKIPEIMGAIYEKRFLGFDKGPRQMYKWMTQNVKVDACVQCGQCQEKCTQNLPIIEELAKSKELFR